MILTSDVVILRESEPLVNQLTSIDMELMLIMKEDKSLSKRWSKAWLWNSLTKYRSVHEFKESKVPFWEDKSVAEFIADDNEAEAATLNQLIYALFCNIEEPFQGRAD